MIQGSLFTRDFLLEGIKGQAAWSSLSDTDVVAARAAITAQMTSIASQRAPNEAETESQVIMPVLDRVLGWADWLPQQNQSALGRDDVPDALLFGDRGTLDVARPKDPWARFQHGLCLVESKRWNRPLDRPAGGGKRTAGESGVPSAQLLRYLRRADDVTRGGLRWGILTNGRLWRLYWQGALSVSEDFLEIDLGRVLDVPGCGPDLLDPPGIDAGHALRLFLLLFGRTAFLPSEHGRTFHAVALEEGRQWEARVARDLSRIVFDDVFPVLADALARADRARPAAPGPAWLDQVRQGALILLYRLLFVLYAEDRDLLPDERGPYAAYCLTRVRHEVAEAKAAGRAPSPRATVYWARLRSIFGAIAHGDDALGIPPYNGGLFEAAAAPILERVDLPDSVLAGIVFALSHVAGARRPEYVNYRDLSVQQLGSIYERILEYGLRLDGDTVVVDRDDAERHDSGSYYTPEALVGLIIDRTVGPAVAAATDAFKVAAMRLAGDRRPVAQRLTELAALDPASALLRLKICDPAMGSGHFLVSLVDWLAPRVLALEAEATALVAWAAYESPLLARVAEVRSRIAEQAAEHGWPISAGQLDDRHVIRRMILKRVVHGVDKNPFAVELAKVALWLHTFTVGAPLSFLDHHLRCGDAIVGAWVRPTMDAVAAGGGLLSGNEVARIEGIAKSMAQIEEITDNDVAEVRASSDTYATVREGTRGLNAFFSFMTARHALGLDLGMRRPRPGALATQVTAYNRTAAFRAILDKSFGDPIRLATGDDVISVATADPLRAVAAGLLAEAQALIARERFLHWPVAFPNAWTNLSAAAPDGGFDAVIGNPPYVRQERLAAIKPALAAGYATYAGTADLYVYFFEQGLRLVRPGGRIGYVVTNKWLKAGYAERLRAMLVDPARAETEALIDFGHARAFFPDADVFPNVAVVRRPDSTPEPDTLIVAVPSRDTRSDEGLNAAVAAASFSLTRASLRPEGWTLEPKPVMELLEKIRRASVSLAEYAGVRPMYGIKTGFNEAFVIDAPTRDRLVASDPSSAEIIKPYLRGQDVERWNAPKSGLYMIFSRRGISIENYPAVLKHLLTFIDQLRPRPISWQEKHPDDKWPGRKPGSYEWFEIQDAVDYYADLDKPKIVYPDITWTASFAIERSGLYVNNTVNFLPTDDEWVCSVLNAPVGWWRSWRAAQHGKDDALRYINSYVETYPIPARPTEALQVDRLIKLKHDIRDAAIITFDWLRLEFGLAVPGRTLEAPERLDANGFAAAVRTALPRRVALSAAAIARLKSEHAMTVEPARRAAAEVMRLERRLSDLVNAAYGLTPEEVALMWTTAPPRMPIPPPVP